MKPVLKTEKRCSHCAVTKQVSEFHRASRESDGLQTWCIKCKQEWKPEDKKRRDFLRYHSDNNRKYRDDYLKRVYGIDQNKYDEILKSQDGVCAICGNVCATGKRLAVDHDHITGKVRGLLCSRCNVSIGRFGEDVEILQKAINYLQERK